MTDSSATTTRKSNNKGSDNLRSLLYDASGPTLQVLDQLLVPHQKTYLPITNVTDAWQVIRSMQIRGAPLIAIVACLGLVVDLHSDKSRQVMENFDDDPSKLLDYVQDKLDYLATSRPTAVNLFNALKELKEKLTEQATKSSGDDVTGSRQDRLVQTVKSYAEFVLQRDECDNRAIGNFGADVILQQATADASKQSQLLRIMTICNTGSLATSAYGTALGVVRALKDRQRLLEVVALETRPYNQGSRLTAFEILEDNLPGRLICDGMSGSFMRNHNVDAVVVGADRVCANGDTANKIGTYTLSLVAAAHHVAFYVAAPFTTLDVSLTSGEDVEIEERPAKELIESSQAPADIAVWNPGFDITPAKNICGIITEKGVILRDDATGVIDVAAFVRKHAAAIS